MDLFRFVPGYESFIYDAGKEPLLFLFLAFLVTFVLVRLYTRLARKHGWGSGNVGGVHLHHVVPGAILMALSGIIAFAGAGRNEIMFEVCAILFGVGGALVLDEFALLLHLKDVYWTEDGRSSIDALIMGVAFAGLFLLSSSPFDEGQEGLQASKTLFFSVLSVNFFFAIIAFLKRKPILGVVALFVPVLGWIPAFRLAKPGSPWARWFYDPERGRQERRVERQRKRDRCVERFEHGWPGRFERWFLNLVGGAPQIVSTPPPRDNEEPLLRR